MKKQTLSYLKYNAWANQKMVDYLQNLPDEQILQEIMNSFPSIRLTLLHISDAEFLWQKRLLGEAPKTFPSATFTGDNAAVFELLMKTSKDFLQNIEQEDDTFFEKMFTYQTISYGGSTQSAYDIVHHCMNHSTYHRGQVTMMLRQLGYTNPPHLDFMLYKMEGF